MANQLGIHYQSTPADELAVTTTQLADDAVRSDEIEDLIVALKRAGAIDGSEMVTLLGQHLGERFSVW